MSAPGGPYGSGETQQWPGERQAQPYVPPPQQALPRVVKTKPSVMRIAFGVFLGLLMFSVLATIASILLLGIFASTLRETIDDIDATTSSTGVLRN